MCTDPHPAVVLAQMLAALEAAAFFMDIAIPREGGWQDAFGSDLMKVRAAIKAAEALSESSAAGGIAG